MGVQPPLSVWPPGEEPLPAKPWSGKGRPPTRVRRDDAHRPLSAKALALRLPAEAWARVELREGEAQPTQYWLSTLPEDMDIKDLIDVIRLRWRIERDYEELKGELGLVLQL